MEYYQNRESFFMYLLYLFILMTIISSYSLFLHHCGVILRIYTLVDQTDKHNFCAHWIYQPSNTDHAMVYTHLEPNFLGSVIISFVTCTPTLKYITVLLYQTHNFDPFNYLFCSHKHIGHSRKHQQKIKETTFRKISQGYTGQKA